MIGRLLNIGFEGTALPRDVAALIRREHLAGITLFTRNFESRSQLKSLTQSIRRAAGSRFIFICVDQEGGRVQRLKEGLAPIPSARELGRMAAAEGDEKFLFELSKKIGRELKAMGINTNFAPVLDIDTQPLNPVIGDRSFGSDPALVSRCGVAVIRGLAAAKVLACGKHFPGHGDTSEDSHLTLPHVGTTRAELVKRELVSFVAAIKAGVKLVMTAHVVYDRIDPKNPATLSPVFLKWLRERLHFKGLILTDDLNMKGISECWNLSEAVEAGLAAGADQFLICRPQIGEIEKLIVDVETRARRSVTLRKKMALASARGTRFRW